MKIKGKFRLEVRVKLMYTRFSNEISNEKTRSYPMFIDVEFSFVTGTFRFPLS
jgi:hypothetical protein